MINTQDIQAEGLIPKTINKEQAKDTGMAMVLILLLIGYFSENTAFFTAAIPVLVVDMIFPTLFRPIAYVWLTLANVLGTVMSKVLLSIVFFVIVTPVGVLRQLLGADTLLLKQWKKDKVSVFKIRDHNFDPEEIERPY